MIDSVLKGSGNSRFLKSAVPAGTSWADVLAMLQAGTFPIDFNGINAEGFQQVGTPLNKANLLKDATAAQIGLPPSTTPDGMFQALGNTGELHVWRKTVVTSQEIPEVPGSYTLGASQQLIVATRTTSNTSRGSGIKGALASNSLLVDLAGNVSLKNPVTIDILVTGRGNPTETASSVLSGCTYFMIPDSATGNYCDITMPRNTVYFVPSYATYDPADMAYGAQSNFDAAQLVTGVPGTPTIPAGTTTTYPVSTSPNAYQEGDDVKAAGYVLGDTVTGNFQVGGYDSMKDVYWDYAKAVTVSDDGVVALKDPSSADIANSTSSKFQTPSVLLGCFAVVTYGEGYLSGSPFAKKQIVYIPSNAVVNGMYIDRYQPVTGYAAIPAGTTIEYLGKLGDKARVQVGSYVGTGTYGYDNPNTLTFGFVPKLLIISGYTSNGTSTVTFVRGASSASFPANGDTYFSMALSWNGKKVSWYNTGYNANLQANKSGAYYNYVAIG